MLYVEYMILIYCHEQEAVRGRVSGRQDLGSLSDPPQVCSDVRVVVFCKTFFNKHRSFNEAPGIAMKLGVSNQI